MEELIITSPCFEEGGLIPVEHTGHGEDRSPELRLNGLREEAVSLAVVMDDMGHPIPSYNHWIIWNIPAAAVVPGGSPPENMYLSWGTPCKDAVTDGIDIADRSRLLAGRMFTDIMYSHWIVIWTCRPAQESIIIGNARAYPAARRTTRALQVTK